MGQDEPSVNGLIVDSLNRLESKVDAGFSAIDVKLDTKADKGDLRELRGELKSHHDRINKLEDAERAREVEDRATKRALDDAAGRAEQIRSRKARKTTFLLSLLGTVAMVLGALSAFGVHL